MSADPSAETPDALARFAADALDWPAVRALLAPFAISALGTRALERVAPRPAPDAAEALARVHELELLLGTSGESPPLAGASDPRPAIAAAALHGRAIEGEVLAALARFLHLVEDVGVWLASKSAALARCAALFRGLPDLGSLRGELEATLDRKGAVRDDASPLLKRLRDSIGALEDAIERTIRELARKPDLRAALAEGHAGRVLRRGGRPVLAVRAQHLARVPGIVHDRSQSGETLFVEPQAVVAHANAVAEQEADAAREVNRVLTELTRSVLQRRESIQLLAERASELELASIAARYARSVGGRPARVPDATQDGAHGELVLRAFRHPLLIEELRLGHLTEVVPIDLRLGGAFDLLVVTGPNTGGKTLALKSAGLAALMTSCGLALPCDEGTSVPLYAGVIADIGDEQEIQQSLSTFSSHLVRIRAGLERASPRTLVLLDELGSGTDPSEGAALSEAILEELLARRVPTIASTHLGKLKEFAYRHERAENAHAEFDVETLAPRYRLVIGAPGESRALAIAQRLGLSAALVARAALHLAEEDPERGLGAVDDLRVEAERLRRRAEERLVEVEGELARIAAQRDELLARGGQLEAEAQRGIEERLLRARAWIVRLRSLLPQLPPAARGAVDEIAAGFEGALGDAALSDRRASFLATLKKGDHVWLPRYKKRCQVTRIKRAQREIDVRLGQRELSVSFDDVTFYESL